MKQDNYKPYEKRLEESFTRRFQDPLTKKWNLQYKDDDSIVSDIWFDELGMCGGFANEYYWSATVYTEPLKETKGAYPYCATGTVYDYSFDGKLLKTTKGVTHGSWGFHDSYKK